MPERAISKLHEDKSLQRTGDWRCKRPECGLPCTCAMGNVSRFIEPVVLRILEETGKSYGYEIAEGLAHHALTDALIEGAALYRTLRTLEANGHVSSTWEAGDGPSRRNYSLTRSGHEHLRDWADLLESLGKAMLKFSRETRSEGRVGRA